MQQRVDVVNALDGLCLEEWVEDELDVVLLGEFRYGHTANDT